MILWYAYFIADFKSSTCLDVPGGKENLSTPLKIHALKSPNNEMENFDATFPDVQKDWICTKGYLTCRVLCAITFFGSSFQDACQLDLV